MSEREVVRDPMLMRAAKALRIGEKRDRKWYLNADERDEAARWLREVDEPARVKKRADERAAFDECREYVREAEESDRAFEELAKCVEEAGRNVQAALIRLQESELARMADRSPGLSWSWRRFRWEKSSAEAEFEQARAEYLTALRSQDLAAAKYKLAEMDRKSRWSAVV